MYPKFNQKIHPNNFPQILAKIHPKNSIFTILQAEIAVALAKRIESYKNISKEGCINPVQQHPHNSNDGK